jgi:hypothetical protein
MTTRLVALLPALVLTSVSCAGAPRFSDRAILWHDPDDLPSPRPPKRPELSITWEGMRDTVFRPLQRQLAFDHHTEARNVNALDELPDSTWFVDRRRDPTAPDDQPRWHPIAPEAAARGAAVDEPPVPPFTVLNEKSDGSATGIVVRDARGVKYMFKLDPLGYPGLVTSIEIVATRLAWAAGFMVAADRLLDVHPAELKLAPDAWSLDRWDRKRPFRQEGLDELLAHSAHHETVRVLASRWIEGDVLGWFSYLGRDRHDANDRVDHQDRRDLRGFGIWASWVDDVDTFDNNTLDSYVGAAGAGHVVHYQQGLGASFGRFAGKPSEYWMGHASYFTIESFFVSIVALGLWPRPWEDHRLMRARAHQMLEWPELGFFDNTHFNPRGWQPLAENPAFARQTRRDRYWGAKQIVAYAPEEVRAAISAGQYPPPVAEHLFEVLWRRRQKIAHAMFTDVAPLDHFQLRGEQLCFEDLWLTAGLGGAAETTYAARERSGNRSLPLAIDAGARCVAVPPASGYRIVELRAHRPGERHFGPAVQVHLIERPGSRHIVGVER